MSTPKGLPDAAKMEELLIRDNVTQMAPGNTVPTIDDDEPEIAEYRDWDPKDTLILTYRIGNDHYKGKYANTRKEAMREVTKNYGRILEANYVPGRAFFRVAKPEGGPSDPGTSPGPNGDGESKGPRYI